MQSTPPPAGDRVVCSNHPQLGADFTCQRCGVFGCEDCRSPFLPTFCQECAQRVAPAGSLTARALLQDSFSLLCRNLPGVGLLLGGGLGGGLLSSLILYSMLPPSRSEWLRTLVSSSAFAFSAAVFLSWTAERLLQLPGRSLLTSLGVGLRRFSSLFLMNVLVVFAVAAGLFLLVLPGLYLAVCLYLAPALVVLEGFGPLQSLKHSYRLTRGHRRPLLALVTVMLLLQAGLWGAGQLFLFFLLKWGGSPWQGMNLLLTLGYLLWSAFFWAVFYGSVVLAWMRLTGRVPSTP